MSKKIFLILIFCTAAAGAIFALYPELDLQISTLFYDRLSGTFGAASNPVLVWIRREGTLVASCLAICIFALLAANVILRANSAVFSRRAAIYLLLVFGLAPGLIVSRVVKEYSHRPRPAAVEPFGGKQKFVAWWDRSGSCSRDCSFASSETATVAWLTVAAALLPGPWQIPAIVLSLAFTAAIGLLRISFGGHFFSDAVFGALITWWTAWILYQVIFERYGKTKAALPRPRSVGRIGTKTLRVALLAILITSVTVYVIGFAFGRDFDIGRDMALFIFGWSFVLAALGLHRAKSLEGKI